MVNVINEAKYAGRVVGIPIVPEAVWYAIPIESAEGSVKLWFNPRSTPARFEKYREALASVGPSEQGRGAGKIFLFDAGVAETK